MLQEGVGTLEAGERRGVERRGAEEETWTRGHETGRRRRSPHGVVRTGSRRKGPKEGDGDSGLSSREQRESGGGRTGTKNMRE
jgi:hypothetical protein